MAILNEYFTLANGVKIPKLALGTWQITDDETAYKSVMTALEYGYRHIDTAYVYGNEKAVGRAVRNSGLKRDEIFVTSKLPAEIKQAPLAREHFEKTMDNLGLDVLDLYLIHAPWPWEEMGKDCTSGNIEVWGVMEEIYNKKGSRSIGVSNFSPSDLQAVIDNSTITPMVNQIRLFAGTPQFENCEYCNKHNILVEAYSPFATGRLLGNQTLDDLAKKYDVTLTRLCLKYLIQRDILPLPKSTHAEYIKANADLDGFVISDADMELLNSLKFDI